MARAAAPFITTGLSFYLLGWAKTPQEWISLGIGFLAVFGCGLAYRRKRGKGLGDDLMAAAEARARARAQTRAAFILQARASAGSVNSTVGSTAGSFPRRRLGPGYRAAEVDEFIARIEATLSGNTMPGQAITAADVQAVKFTVTRRGGYDERTMDEVLDRYADQLDKLTPFPQARPSATDADPRFRRPVFPRSTESACIDIAKPGFPCVPMIITLECQRLNKASSFIH
jgi:DivIVA domain-containing protein